MRIIVKDMTKLFTKEMLLYSIFDKSFKRPLRIVVVSYFLVFLAVWIFPLAYLLWPLKGYEVFIVLAPPIVLTNLMSKPIWGGKSFISWLKCQIRFLFSKKRFYDGYASKRIGVPHQVHHSYTVSRRKDYIKLFYEIQAEKEAKKHERKR